MPAPKNIFHLPKEGPRITGNEQENRRGDSMFLNCTSGRSYPAAVLSWDIDGEKTMLHKAGLPIISI
ncbi:unnamed protein product [Diatraea saccharalis]|uniref:Ig-like domain-containing protein n=1 Tax=Diatraea saccharalis TaxID=40085 RepID=A0A9N9QXC3_9NEOP|nr:unnamed protein product [Diatraea saccharalis]